MSYPGQPQQQVIYQQVVRPPSNGIATTSLVFGIVGAVIGIWAWIPFLGLAAAGMGFPLALVAVITGHIGLNRSKEMGVGRSFAGTGMTLGYVTLAVIVLVTLFWIVAMIIGSANSQPTT